MEQRCCWDLAELGELPQVEVAVDIHCVTRWSKLAVPFGGVLLKDLLSAARPLGTTRFVSFEAASDRGHATSLPIADAIELETLIALRAGVRRSPSITAGRSALWFRAGTLQESEVVPPDRVIGRGSPRILGIARRIPQHGRSVERAAVRRRRDLPGRGHQDSLGIESIRDRTLLGIAAAGLELPELVADRATLRNADFSAANLTSASFRAANLSNARFVAAILQHAEFTAADVEGADFHRGRSSRRALLRSLALRRTFIGSPSPRPNSSHPHPVQNQHAAIFDATTRIDPAAVEMLTPLQQDFVRRELARHASPSTPAAEES